MGDVDGFLASLKESAGRLFTDIRIERIVDKQAVKAGVVDAFRRVAEQARPEGRVRLFLRGPRYSLGWAKPRDNDFYFVLHDLTQMTSVDQVAKAGISGAEFRALVADIKPRSSSR